MRVYIDTDLFMDSIPSDNHELCVPSLRSKAPPDVHSEDSATAVEDGRQRTHEGSNHHCHHQSLGTWSHVADREHKQGDWRIYISQIMY